MNEPVRRRQQRYAATVISTLTVAGGLLCMPFALQAQTPELPDAPSALLMAAAATAPEIAAPKEADAQVAKGRAQTPTVTPTPAPTSLPDCPTGIFSNFTFLSQKDRAICQEQNPLEFIVEPGPVKPLTPRQKAILAGKGVIDPFNLITIVAFSGITVASNAHCSCTGGNTAGFHGWGILIGYSLAENIQGETTGTFLLPVIFHEDPRYHRLPGHPIGQRIWHAIGHTVISQGDDGHIIPNYATLINYPLSDVISNQYVPGLATDAASTAKRVALGYATDPVGAIVAEFLPDVAKRIHIHILFAQQILNQLATGQTFNP